MTSGTPLAIEVNGAGRAWGLCYDNDFALKEGQLSEYTILPLRDNSEMSGHTWLLASGTDATRFRCRTSWPTQYPLIGWVIGTDNLYRAFAWDDTAAGYITGACPTANNPYHLILMTPDEVAERGLITVTPYLAAGGGTMTLSNRNVFEAITATTSDVFLAENLESRVNSSALLLTNVEPTIYKSGSVNCARVVASDAPRMPWQDYLFTLDNTYQGQWKYGGFSPLFSNGAQGDGSFMRAKTYYLNQFVYDHTPVDVMYVTSTLESARNFSTVQIKLHQWTDYKTAEPRITRVTPEFAILWGKLISLANRTTQPTDNPDHMKFMRDAYKAVNWLIRSPDAQGYRDVAKGVSSAAIRALPALASALL
jgi:hypothetical protein